MKNISQKYIREKVIEDIRSVNDDWDLIYLVDEIGVSLPQEIIDFYKNNIDFKREKGTDIRERICARSFFALYYFGRKTSTGGTKQ